jgi:hypothetical protein
VELQCHPTTFAQSVRSVHARVSWESREVLELTFSLAGDLSRLRIPAPRPARRVDGLWRHTCFEVFLRHKEEPAYREFNFAPSGEWATYTFCRYRDGMALAETGDPRIAVRKSGDRLELDAFIKLGCLSLVQQRVQLQLALSAVVEDEQGVLSYWALKHPPGKPDFHHPDAFALELERSEAANISAEEEKR